MVIEDKLLRKIKKEYLTTRTSYRKLADKYGLCYTSLAKEGKKNNWETLRQQSREKAQTREIDAASSVMAAREEKFYKLADKLMDRIEALAAKEDAGELSSRDIRALAASLKDLREINGIKSEADKTEQEARIAKLRKEAESDAPPPVINVTLGGGLEDLSV